MKKEFIEKTNGVPIFIFSEHNDGDNVRFHKKKRIRKKWRKRYGVVRTGLKAGDMILISEPNPKLYMSRKTYAFLKSCSSEKNEN